MSQAESGDLNNRLAVSGGVREQEALLRQAAGLCNHLHTLESYYQIGRRLAGCSLAVNAIDVMAYCCMAPDCMRAQHKGMGVVCARKGIDVVEACRSSDANPARGLAGPGASGALIPADGSAYAESYMDVDVRDCRVLSQVVNPLCSFDPPAESARLFHSKVRAGKGWTIEFWIKIDSKTRIPKNNGDYKDNPTSMRRIVFFSRVSPPRVLATITLRTNFDDLEFQAFGNCLPYHMARIAVSFPQASPLKPDSWIKITMVYGASNDDGKLGIRIFQGSQTAFEFLDELDWCETEDDFLQALQLPGGVLISPIQITPKALCVKEVQERFYQQKPGMDLRRGPAQSDQQRQSARIAYSRASFIYPVSLMAPPIVLQKRIQLTDSCSTMAG